MQASILFIFMLIEHKTLYDSRVHSHNFPQHRPIQYAQPEKQAKEPCIIGGEYPDNRFLSSNKRKTEKEKERGNSQLSKHLERTTLSFV